MTSCLRLCVHAPVKRAAIDFNPLIRTGLIHLIHRNGSDIHRLNTDIAAGLHVMLCGCQPSSVTAHHRSCVQRLSLQHESRAVQPLWLLLQLFSRSPSSPSDSVPCPHASRFAALFVVLVVEPHCSCGNVVDGNGALSAAVSLLCPSWLYLPSADVILTLLQESPPSRLRLCCESLTRPDLCWARPGDTEASSPLISASRCRSLHHCSPVCRPLLALQQLPALLFLPVVPPPASSTLGAADVAMVA